jgi:hypothetical protein
MAHTRSPFKWPQWIGTVVSSCNGKSRSLPKIAKTNLLASVPFFFAPFASLREDRPGSLAKIAKIAKKSLFCSPLRPYRISPLEPFLSAGRLTRMGDVASLFILLILRDRGTKEQREKEKEV